MEVLRMVYKATAAYRLFSLKIAHNIVVLLLFAMFMLMVTTAREETAIMDELAHIPAGYSYLTHQDMRINPEHPPLLKDIAAAPLLFLDLNFPETSKAWTSDVNGQWILGDELLYKSGNNPDQIVFWSRVGPMLLTILFGTLLFKLGSQFFNVKTALLAVTLFAFSPALLAHGKYVTTDVAAAFGFFTAIFYFLRYLREPSRRNLVIAGVIFGIAQSLKFSLVLLIPFLLGIGALWAFSQNAHTWRERFRAAFRSFVPTLLIFVIGSVLVIWPLYQFHVWNYPAAPASAAQRAEILAVKTCDTLDVATIGPSQFRDTVCNLKGFRVRPIADLVAWASDKPVLRPFAQYALGVFMVGKRAVGGNTTYFLGEVSRNSWWYYFPVVYLLKEPLAMHIMTLAALAIILAATPFRRRINIHRTLSWTHEHFTEVTAALFIAFYWSTSMAANLNIGVRHVIPTFPFIFLLVSHALLSWLARRPDFPFALSLEGIRELARFYLGKVWKYCAFAILVLWYIISVLVHYPYYIAYFNELAGGAKNGHRYVADSNLDWGQDMKRLVRFVEKNNIDKIRVAYFGGGSPDYYLKDKYIPWWSSRGGEPGWYAISATFLDEARGTPIGNYVRTEENSYPWLRGKTPVTVIGNSIFVFKLE